MADDKRLNPPGSPSVPTPFDEKHTGPAAGDDLTDNTVNLHSIAKPESVTLSPTASAALPPVGFFELFRYHTRFEIFLNVLGVLCAMAGGSAQPVMTIIFGRLTQNFVGFGSTTELVVNNQALEAALTNFKKQASRNATWLVIIGVGMFCVTYSYMYIWTWTGEINSKRIRERYLQAILRQDVAYFDQLGAGEVATRIETDTHLIQQGMSEKVPLSVAFSSAFVSGFVIAYVRNWRMALVVSCVVPCITITVTLMQKSGAKLKELSLTSVAEGGTVAEEVISTVRTTQAFGTQKVLGELYNKRIDVGYNAELKMAFVSGGFLGLMFFLVMCMYSLSFYWGTTLILQGHANSGSIVNVVFAILMGAFSLGQLGPEMQAIGEARAAAAKIFTTIDRVPPIDSFSTEGLRPKQVLGDITFHGVSFHYPSRPDVPVLKNLSLVFEAGKTAALVGASGCGKSTVIQLMERFYDPIDGEVQLDGFNIKDLNLKWLRQQIGFVQQEPILFATTIYENVAFGLIGTTHEKASDGQKFGLIKDACVKANADSFIAKLPNGYNTLVGERGFLMSGGQKQRIAIARAIVSDPKILLLDEATSALDTQSEGIVQDALDKAAAGRTTITVAHRLSTIQDADCIYVMGAGGILEKGTHEELLANADGPYSQLVKAQELRGQGRRVTPQPQIMTKQEVEVALAKEEPNAETKSLADEILEKKPEPIKERHLGWITLFGRMASIVSDQRLKYMAGALGAVCVGLIYPCFGIVFAQTLTTFASPDRHYIRTQGNRDALWFLVIAICNGIASSQQNFWFTRAGAHLVRRLREGTFKAILRQDIGWFDEERHSTGALVSILSDTPTKISGLAGVTLAAILASACSVVGGAIIGLVYGPKLAAVGIACVPFIVSAGYVRLRVVVLKDQVNRRAHQASAQKACEAAASVRTVQSLTREEQCYLDYSRSLEGPLHHSNRSSLFSTSLYALSQSMSFFVIALVFWYGSRLIASGEYGIKAFFVCLMSVVFGAMQAGNVFNFVPDMSAAKGAANEIVNLMDHLPEVDAESPDGEKLDSNKLHGHIRFEDVHFRYPTRPGVPVLSGLDLAVEPGTYVALVGESGCGKSTVVQLIERFYDPLAGRVLFDGYDVSKLNVQDYRKELAIVSQEPTLYAGSIRFNILLGAAKPVSEVTEEEIEQACADANILEFVQSLPQGFETEVGGKGSQLSGGQKQRIAIARALLRKPKVLLLDEATSALDSQSERVVQSALDNAAKGRTTIAIAHRLSTIQNADRIFFIKDGRVAETGTHEELLAKRGFYFQMVQLQALSQV